MIFKVFFSMARNYKFDISECRIFAVENGQTLERRIKETISNLKADGYSEVRVHDCFNISEPELCPNR